MDKNREVRYSAEYGFCRLCYLLLDASSDGFHVLLLDVTRQKQERSNTRYLKAYSRLRLPIRVLNTLCISSVTESDTS